MVASSSSKPPPTPEGGGLMLMSTTSASVTKQQSLPVQQQQIQPQPSPQQHQEIPKDQMEVELAEMRKAFEEYIATTQDLEVNLDVELQDMQGKLDESAFAYETLTSKLTTMEPMLRNLELSLGGTKKRLKEESKLRRTAEIAQVEAETRVQEVRDQSKAFQKECKALRAELEYKTGENSQLKRQNETSRQQLEEFADRLSSSIQNRRVERADDNSSILRNVDSGVITEAASNKSQLRTVLTPGDESYAEVLDELETVTEQMITTQQKLWRTEDQLRESEARAANLEADIRSLKNEQEKSSSKEHDKDLSLELDQIRSELARTKRELGESEATGSTKYLTFHDRDMEDEDYSIEVLKEQIEELEDSAQMSHEQVKGLEMLLEESQDENIRLVEEIASLRIILQDEVEQQDSQEVMKETISKEVRAQVVKEANEVREKEINALREEFKKMFKENTSLKEKLDKLETGSLFVTGDYQLKKEVEKLKADLLRAQDEHKSALSEVEASWKAKMEQVMTGEFIPEDLLEEMEEEMKTAIDSAAQRVRELQSDKEVLESKVDSLVRDLDFTKSKLNNSYTRYQDLESNLRVSKDEILRLKKSNTHLTSELEYTTRIMSRMDAECERLTRQHSELKAELEVALQVIESGGLDQETVHTEETIKAKEKVHRLTSNLNKLKGDYSALLNELEVTRSHFLDAQEEAAKQREVEMNKLSDTILDLEEQLEEMTKENMDNSRKLQEARKYQTNDTIEKDNKKRELQVELNAANRIISDSKNDIQNSNPEQKSLQKELKHCKDALSSSRIENKRLEEEIERIRSDMSVCPRTRLSRDPDPVEETLNRDPPPVTRTISEVTPRDTNQLMLQNELLKKKIAVLSKRNVGVSSPRDLFDSEDDLFDLEGVLESTEQKIRETEQKISKSGLETVELKMQVKTLKEALRDAHSIHSETAQQLELAKRKCEELRQSSGTGRKDAEDAKAELEEQVLKLRDEKTSLQHQVDDSKIGLSVSEYAQERMKEELRTCQAKLEKSQNNVLKLKMEIKKLAGAFSGLRNDHEKLVKEVGSSRAQKEFVPATLSTDDEFHEQLKKFVAENSELQDFISSIKNKMREYENEISLKTSEIESLKCNLLTTQEEARLLSEEITNLSTAFENAQTEYDAVVDELDAVQSLFEKSREAAEECGKDTATQELHQKIAAEGQEQKKLMTAQLEKALSENIKLQQELHETENSLSQVLKLSRSNNVSHGLKKESEILQMALQDSQSEVKALKERCFELEVLVKHTSKGDEHEEIGHLPLDERIVAAVFDSEEMQDLKEQFNALIEENINLEQVVRQSELALTLAKDVEERNKSEMTKLEKDLSDLKETKLGLQEEVYSLTVELENSSDDHLKILANAREVMKTELGSKTLSLQYQVDALSIENASLKSRNQKLVESDSQTKNRMHEELLKLKMELQSVVGEKASAVQEKVAVETKVAELEAKLKDFADQVQALQNEVSDAHHQRSELVKQLNDATGSNDSSTIFSGEKPVEGVNTTFDYEATMVVFERINSLLASVDFLERHHEINLRTSHSQLTLASQKAEEIRRKIAFLTYAFQKEKKEHSDVLFQLKSASLRLNDLAEAKDQNDALTDLQGEKKKLEARLEATERSLESALESEKRHKAELEATESKYQESQNDAEHFQLQLLNLQETLKEAKQHQIISADIAAFEDAGMAGMATHPLLQRLSQENETLQGRLEETDAALSVARTMKFEYEEKIRFLNSEGQGSLDAAFVSHHATLQSNDRSFEDITRGQAASTETEELSHHAKAEIRLLKSQFQKLNEQSDALAKQVQLAENAVTSVRDKQVSLKDDTKTKELLAQALQSQIEQNKKRSLEFGELAIFMENRLNLTEESVEKIEHQLSSTKSSSEISRTGMLMDQGRESAARLEKLVKLRSDSTPKTQEILSPPESAPVTVVVQSEEDSKDIEIIKLHSQSTQEVEVEDIRDDKEYEAEDAPLTVWSVSLSEDVISATPVAAADPDSNERSISPFTLSLLSDNCNNNNNNSAFGSDLLGSPASSAMESVDINESQEEYEVGLGEAPAGAVALPPSASADLAAILEACSEGDNNDEQRE